VDETGKTAALCLNNTYSPRWENLKQNGAGFASPVGVENKS